ncbi:MAG: phenazine antibiotic biosynthesis protein [Balneola sp.]|nr:MAG: phenazine antibiotic biosynthesis protein [Balneola sp.]
MITEILDQRIGSEVKEKDFIAAAMSWHFNPNTGSPYWVERSKILGFDPQKEIKTFADLQKFPNVVDEMRKVPVQNLIPVGYGPKPPVFGVFDSGGTTGIPKRVVVLEDWVNLQLSWQDEKVAAHGILPGKNICYVGPSGPHMFGAYTAERARRTRGLNFPIDLDPRWVKRSLEAGHKEEVERYVRHLVEQASTILETQDIGLLITTPPLLERMAREDKLVDLINEKVTGIQWGGAHMDADTRELYRNKVFPEVSLVGNYGSAMMLGGVIERPEKRNDDLCVFDPLSPFVTFKVVHPDTHEEVPYGERGQLLMHHISRNMFLPNNLERDMGTRVEALSGHLGDAVADVYPVQTFEGKTVIEGVY